MKYKSLAILLLCAFLLGVMDFGDVKVNAATAVTDSREGSDGAFTYSLWKDYGDTRMTLNGNGKFECSWQNIGNALFREGIKFDCTKNYKQLGDMTVKYGVDYRPDGNSYMCVYGWSRNPLIEYYIVDSWGTWRPPGAGSKGRIEVDGGTYDIYETTRVDQPSIDGNTTFKQYWSVRTEKRTSGTISVTEHFKAWDKLGMNLGNLYEVSLNIEGYQSNGSAEVYTNVITIDDSKAGDDKEDPGKDGKNPENTGISFGNNGIFECESMSLSGRYAGSTYSPFNGVALYANEDQAVTTVNFSQGKYDFTLRGASDGENKAKVDLVIGNRTAGTFSFSGTSASDSTVKDVSVNTGDQDIKLVLTTDDGTWDVFIDRLTITEAKVSSKPSSPVSAKKNDKPYITVKEKKCEIGDKFYVRLKGTKAVKYTIADETVAKVSAKGKVKIKRAGKTKLTVLGENGKKYTCKIKAYDHEKNSISLTSESKDSKTTAKIKAEDVPTIDFKVSPATLINFTHILNTKGVPEGLIRLKNSKVSKKLKYRDTDCRLQSEVIKLLTQMVEDAYAAGKHVYTIEAGGGYREYSTQDRYWQRRQNMYPGYGDDPYHNGGVICVPAVSSEHRTGFAIDFETTEAGFNWLKENCYKYGFIHRYTGDKTEKTGVMDEDCHYTYVGKAVAATCYLEGLCLEEYYEKYVWSDEKA